MSAPAGIVRDCWRNHFLQAAVTGVICFMSASGKILQCRQLYEARHKALIPQRFPKATWELLLIHWSLLSIQVRRAMRCSLTLLDLLQGQAHLVRLAFLLPSLSFQVANRLAMAAWSGAACLRPAIRAFTAAELSLCSTACLQAASTEGVLWELCQLSSAAR